MNAPTLDRRAWLLGCAGLACTAARAAPSAHNPTRLLDAEAFARLRAAHQGRPWIVHLWGLTCGPCMEELPRWGTLLRQQPDLPLVLIQADATPPGAADAMLRKSGLARAERWAVAEPLDEFGRAAIDPSWMGELPRTQLHAADGTHFVIRGVADTGEVRRWWASVKAGGAAAAASR